MSSEERKKILMIDDDKVQLIIAQKSLKEDYEFTTVNSGQKALKLFYEGFVPNLILLDILMPEMDGWEVFKLIKAISLLHDVPIAFLTSLHEAGNEDHAFELGAADYIRKPFKEDDLRKRIKVILERA